MKTLITGAAGFIGSQLAHRMWSTGIPLVLVDNFSYGSEDNLEFEDHNFVNEVLNVDIRDRKAMEHIFKTEQIDYVYNIAGIAPLPDCQSNPCDAVDVNLTAFVNILELSRRWGG